MRKNVKYLLFFLFILVVFIISAIFGVHNNQIVVFHYFIAQGHHHVSTLIKMLLSAGLILGWMIYDLFYLRAYIALGRAKRTISVLTRQLKQFAQVEACCSVNKE